jgi:hypothetical protein
MPETPPPSSPRGGGGEAPDPRNFSAAAAPKPPSKGASGEAAVCALRMEDLTVWAVERAAKFPRDHKFTVGDKWVLCACGRQTPARTSAARWPKASAQSAGAAPRDPETAAHKSTAALDHRSKMPSPHPQHTDESTTARRAWHSARPGPAETPPRSPPAASHAQQPAHDLAASARLHGSTAKRSLCLLPGG